MLAKGDKLIVTKEVASFLKDGDIVEVTEISENGMISFAFGEDFLHKGVMSMSEYEEHFEKYEEPTMTFSVTQERIDEILENSEISIQTVFDKCTIVSCKLPNGFVIVESSACVDPDNYDEELGFDICMDKITDKIWELEAYSLQELLHTVMKTEECPYDYDCDDCPCDGCYDECEVEEEYEDDVNCNNCEDYDCPYNLCNS